MLPWSWAVERLERSRNYWIASTRPDGSPHAAPVWGVWIDDSVVFGTHSLSRKARNLRRDPRVAVHLESGDETVILEGEAELIEPDDRIADAFEPKYEWRPDPSTAADESWFRLRPRVAYAWLERDYVKSATRFTFE
jgi:PPOX class probable F420-dependent enzyme